MYYVYVLRSEETGDFYVGSTKDLKNRFYQHNSGENKSTIYGRPWVVVYYEAYLTKALAMSREKRLKHHGKGISEIKKRAGFC